LPGHRSPGREQIRAHGQPRGRYSRNAWLLILSSALGSGVFLGAVQLLNETKRRFKSKELAEVRGMLETLLKESL